MKYILTSLWRAYTGTHLITRIFCGILLGAALAILCPGINGISILGNLFVGALKSVAPILVAVLVTASVAQASGGLGKRFGTVIGLYISSTLIASLVAVLASRLFPVTLTLTGVDAGGEMAGSC